MTKIIQTYEYKTIKMKEMENGEIGIISYNQNYECSGNMVIAEKIKNEIRVRKILIGENDFKREWINGEWLVDIFAKKKV